jgi:hypothetical protein
MIQSVAEHQVAPKEDAVVKPVKGRKKRHRGQEASCRVTRRAKGTDPRRLWIREVVGCRLQDGVQLCKSGMAKKEPLEKNRDPGKLWTAQGIRTTHCAKVARGREYELQRQGKVDIAPRTRKGRNV